MLPLTRIICYTSVIICATWKCKYYIFIIHEKIFSNFLFVFKPVYRLL